MDTAFWLVVLIVSVILHEVAHGYMANWLGDPTARLQGRLTLNPISHLDPVGSVLLPLILSITGSPFLIGYAKPVPYNPYNLPGKYDETLVAAAGPGTNIVLAVLFGLIIRFGAAAISPTMLHAFTVIVLVNMVLAIFNLIPIPPLDGSKILSGILPGALSEGYDLFRSNFERLGVLSGTLLILVVYIFLAPYSQAFITWLYILLTGAAI
ncbi:MAG: site-2 protease family protein [Patescibacteria group bacterium]